MSKSAEKQRVPIRAIIMVLVALAIAFLALGWHGFLTRNDADNAALLAQEAKLSERAPASTPVCLVAVGDPASRQSVAAEKDTRAKLTNGDVEVAGKAQAWGAAPGAPRVITVYSVQGQVEAAKNAAAALGAPVAERPAGLDACADSVAVVVP